MEVDFKFELERAVKSGDLNEVRRLFEPSDLECNEYGGSNHLLHYAAKWSTLEVVKFLVESGADVNQLRRWVSCARPNLRRRQGNWILSATLWSRARPLTCVEPFETPCLLPPRRTLGGR